MVNAKQELLKIVNAKKLTILKIDVTFYDTFNDGRNTIAKSISSLDELDFNYNNYFGVQSLFGSVYCKNSDNRPVWLRRVIDDGKEWWDVNTLPKFYDTIK